MRADVKWIDCMQVWLDRVLVILDDGDCCSVCIEVNRLFRN